MRNSQIFENRWRCQHKNKTKFMWFLDWGLLHFKQTKNTSIYTLLKRKRDLHFLTTTYLHLPITIWNFLSYLYSQFLLLLILHFYIFIKFLISKTYPDRSRLFYVSIYHLLKFNISISKVNFFFILCRKWNLKWNTHKNGQSLM